ncbi:DUF167 domain-containing protein [Pseudogemmobacter blasticus]|uniref:Uncharacterized protein n=1 Tax=Fuscovulum blasticum DSM 2131 TaxID=1188250 RepID=A0A2T4JCW0_FUSBL|nr:DUF167 domain-containing protein [Fuscovulum blasticum]AWD21332.1 hypothetical protein B6K69_06305 [Fuscovulum blasticum]PTE15731.1 hypothetical protein C5F44_05055 [Fuscovulum blasticum DSM 2131]
MDLPDLSHLARPGAEIAVRVTPNARRAGLDAGPPIRIAVTVVPEDGKATAAAQVLLAQALGVAKSRLVLLRGAKARDKVFRLD